MRKQSISAAVVLEFRELLKLLNEVQNHIETLACYLNVSILVIVIGSFFIFRSECFIIPTSLSYKRSYQKFMFNCSTYSLCPIIRIATNGSTSLNENF